MSDALGDYLRTISRIPLLTASEELHLGGIIQEWLTAAEASRHLERRGRRAMHRMVSANLRLVVSLCMRHQARISHLQLDPMDLIQAGNLGLIRAVERYDPSRGYKFSTYGYWWIRQAVNRYLREQARTIRVPVHVTELAMRVEQLQARSHGSVPLEAIAEHLGESHARVDFVLTVNHRSNTVSLDQQIDCGEADVSLIDRVSDGVVPAPDEDYGWLHDQLDQLDPREQTVIRLRYAAQEHLSMAKVSQITGLTKDQVQRIERQALHKLRRRVLPMLMPC
ncbi:MAG: sigma-70 family RNA polymerase sigma factor [Cyanobacteriota bacterium]|nr:sigma-70 family RNA polymerase sigma factor [Cyanobacteriota bacterium]